MTTKPTLWQARAWTAKYEADRFTHRGSLNETDNCNLEIIVSVLASSSGDARAKAREFMPWLVPADVIRVFPLETWKA